MIKKPQKKILILFLLFPLFTQATENSHHQNNSKGVFSDIKSYTKDTIELWKALWNNRSEVAALTVSSPWLIREIISPAAKHQIPRKSIRILEVGFGPGTVTRELITYLQEDDHLDAIELIPSMYDVAKKNLPDQKNVQLICANFAEWLPKNVTNLDTISEEQQYDFIITTLPFTQLPQEVLVPILKRIETLLKPQGTFTYIALLGSATVTSLFTWGKKNEEYQKKMTIFSDWKKEYFYSLTEEFTPSRSGMVYLNMPPNRVTHLIKK